MKLFKILTYNISFSLTIVFFYGLSWFLFDKTGIKLGVVISGILLLFIFPGLIFLKLVDLENNKDSFGKISLIIVSSLAILVLGQKFLFLRFPFTFEGQLNLLFFINIGLAIFYSIWKKKRILSLKKLKKDRDKYTFNFLLKYIRNNYIYLIPFFIWFAAFIINPYIEDADGYLNGIIESIKYEEYSEMRNSLFVNFIALISIITKIETVWCYKILFPLLVLISFFYLGSYAKLILKRKWLWQIFFLLVLSPSVIFMEMNIIRPQLGVLVFIFPVLVLLIESVREKNLNKLFTAFCYSFVAMLFHELGIFLLFITSIASGYIFFQGIVVLKNIKITKEKILLAFIVLYPYYQLLGINDLISKYIGWGKFTLEQSKFTFRWWFINNYTAIDGNNISWKGISVLYYYLYNGLLFLIGFLSLLFFKGKNKKIIKKNKTNFINLFEKYIKYIIPGVFSILFIFIAEVFPRIGIYFLPNRAWLFLMCGLLVWFLILLKKKQRYIKNKQKKLIYFISGCLILSGVGADFYLSYNKVGTVFRSEEKAIRYIKDNTNINAFFISTQGDNADLIKYNAKRQFGGFSLLKEENSNYWYFEDKNDFLNKIKERIKKTLENNNKIIKPEEYTITKKYKGNKLINENRVILKKEKIFDAPFKITNEQEYYFIYSFAKQSGLNASREYNKGDRLDYENQNFFTGYTGDEVIFNDGKIIIIKIEI